MNETERNVMKLYGDGNALEKLAESVGLEFEDLRWICIQLR